MNTQGHELGICSHFRSLLGKKIQFHVSFSVLRYTEETTKISKQTRPAMSPVHKPATMFWARPWMHGRTPPSKITGSAPSRKTQASFLDVADRQMSAGECYQVQFICHSSSRPLGLVSCPPALRTPCRLSSDRSPPPSGQGTREVERQGRALEPMPNPPACRPLFTTQELQGNCEDQS